MIRTSPIVGGISYLGVDGKQCRLTQATEISVARRYMSRAGRIMPYME